MGHPFSVHVAVEEALSCEEVFYLLDEDVATHVGDGFGEGELFGAGLDAVLGEAHSWMPPSPARARRRSSLRTAPLGSMLKSLAWAMVAAPTKPVASLNCGQTSMQMVQEMQFESG